MLVGRRGMSPVMIGRNAALGHLAGLVTGDRLDDDLPAVALVAGEAGVGKTRLLQELIVSVPDGTAVLTAHADPGSLGRPLDLIKSMLGDVTGAPVDGRPGAVDAVVARIGERRSLVVFEDLHWADSDSVAVFEVLAGMRLPALTLIATYRPDELTSRLPGGEMLVRLERRRHVNQLHIERLDRHETAAFLAAVYGRTLSTAVIDALRSRTGGNPFFLEEILAAAGDVEPEALADQPLPWSLAEIVSRQLDGLSVDERRVIEAAAVIGPRAPFDVLAALSHRSEDELIAALRTLVERGLLVEEDEDQFSFRHELVRDAIESQLLGRERRRLHEQALDALRESVWSDLADLARHAAGAGRYDEMVELAREGVAHYLEIGSSHQALRLAAAALAESPDDLDLLAGASRAAWLIGAHGEAWAHAERLLQLTVGRSGERRSAAVRMGARIAHERRDKDRMWSLVDELRAAADELSSGEERALAMAAVAQISMLNMRPQEAVEWAERAAREADTIGAKRVLAQALVERATALTDIPERRDEGSVALVGAVAEAERVEDWVLVARALNNLTNIVPRGEQRNHIERMREAGRRAGYDHMVETNYHLRLTEIAMADGDAATAWHHVMRASDDLEGKSGEWARGLRFMLLLESGRVDEAASVLSALLRQPSAAAHEKWWPSSYQVVLAARTGDRTGAAEAFATLVSERRSKDVHGCDDFLETLEAALASGVPAAEVTAAAERWRFEQRFPWCHVAFGVFLAAVCADHDAVIELLDGHLDRIAELSAPRRASLRLILSRALAARGRIADAREHAAAARSMLEKWPGWRRDEADAMIARLEAASSSNDGELTRREREVAALLAEGLSNSELARRLYISPKTAAVHVSNILTKLGMSSRTEIAAWAVRNGLPAA